MKVYAVEVQRDGHTVKAPGVSETTVRKEQFLFAAENIARVWEAIDFIRTDPEATLTGVWEQYPAIQILASAAQAPSPEEK